MSENLNTGTARTEWPFAVSVETDGVTEFIHFSTKLAADFYAEMLDQATTKRFVALDPSIDLPESDNGWREVSRFVL